MSSPVGSYYASGFKPISLYCATDSIRSAPLGTGSYKIGGYFYIYLETMVLQYKKQLKQNLKDINKSYGSIKIKLVK